jgi:hypothetical protein
MTWVIVGSVIAAFLGYLWRVVTWKPRAQRGTK